MNRDDCLTSICPLRDAAIRAVSPVLTHLRSIRVLYFDINSNTFLSLPI